jgi:hypothetical protein
MTLRPPWGGTGVAPGSVALSLALDAHGAALLRFDVDAG